MQVSAEIRWFWPGKPPTEITTWFCEGGPQQCAASGGSVRLDEYLVDTGQVELGIKRRGGKAGVEVKGLVTTVRPGLTANPFVGPIEIWTKWKSDSLSLDSMNTVGIQKQRWLRKFDTSGPTLTEIALDAAEQLINGNNPPVRGCDIELTLLTIVDDVNWWTFGFESFGTLATVEHDLRAVTNAWNRMVPPLTQRGMLANYPTWLRNAWLGADDPKG